MLLFPEERLMHDEKKRDLTEREFSRRDFVGMSVAAGVVAGASSSLAADLAWAVDSKTGMQYRTLGKTGEKVSMMGLGGFHIGVQKDEAESTKIIRTAIDSGVTFLDNCWDYNGGESEVRMGKALRKRELLPDLILCSTALRTRQTIALFLKAADQGATHKAAITGDKDFL